MEKSFTENQKAAYEEPDNFEKELEYGKVLIENDLLGPFTPYQVFESVSKFIDFITNIVIPQTVLYSQQIRHVFTTNVAEMKAFFDMHLVMGYHVLPALRDYWSTDPDLGVPYIANVMSSKRFGRDSKILTF